MKIHTSFKRAFPVSAVWFGALVGPSMISGAFASVYFAPYGKFGLILPFISMGTASIIIFFGMLGVCHFKVYDYSSYARKLYGKYSPILAPLLEIYIILAMLIGGSAVISMGSTFFSSIFPVSALVGGIIMAVLSSILVLWGADLLRKSSTVMTVLLVAGFLFIALFCIFHSQPELSQIFNTPSSQSQPELFSAIKGAVLLGLSNASNAITLCSVAQNINTSNDAKMVGIISFFLNSFAFICSTLILLPYIPEILSCDTPVLQILLDTSSTCRPVLIVIYNLIMFLGLVSSGAPQLNAVTYRMYPLYPDRGIFHKSVVRNLITSIIYMTACIFISFLGLQTIINKGYQFLGNFALFLIVIPLCIIFPVRLHNNKK